MHSPQPGQSNLSVAASVASLTDATILHDRPLFIRGMNYDQAVRELEKLTCTNSIAIRDFKDLHCLPANRLRVAYDQQARPQAHATTSYKPLELPDWLNAISDIIYARDIGADKINFHLPDEIQFESRRDLTKGERFMDFVDSIASMIGIRSVWENAYIASTQDWSCLENASYIPSDRILCLDIGHIMLLSKDQQEALDRIDRFLDQHSDRVAHLHLHVNDLVKDLHICEPKVVRDYLGYARFNRLTNGRSYIFEAPASADM